MSLYLITKANLPLSWQRYIDEWEVYLNQAWGLAKGFSVKIAVFLIVNWLYGNRFNIISGYRSSARQAQLRELWDAGKREGLAYKPALNSRHSYTDLDGPAAKAIDIKFLYQEWAGEIAPYFGIKWGGDFEEPDPNHFYE